jgi:DNA-binding CsgD family transcriptional regulator
MLLTLSDRDQSLVHRLLMAAPEPGQDLLSPDVVDTLARLVRCDLVEVVELDRAGHRVRGFDRLPHGWRPLGLGHGMVRLAFATPADTVVTLSLRRCGEPFTDRDVAVLQMVEPVLARLVRGRARLGDDGGLSGSERRVLELVASGASNADVAHQLSVSVSTVRKHLEHCYRKLGVSNRTAAVAALREARPLPPAVPEQREGSRIG